MRRSTSHGLIGCSGWHRTAIATGLMPADRTVADMTTHMNQPTTDHRPATTGTTTSPTVTPKRPLPRWVAPVGVACAVGVAAAGIGILVADANNQPAPPPTDSATEYGSSQRLVQPSIDAALAETNAAPTSATGRLLQPGRPDGGVLQPATTGAVAPAGGAGSIGRPGRPDGYWQPAENASSAAPVANHGCKISGPC